MKKIGIIGCGVMGEALAKAMIKKIAAEQIHLFDIDQERVKKLSQTLSCKGESSSKLLVSKVDYLILAVKPAHLPSLLGDIANTYFEKKPVIISILAGISIEKIESLLHSAHNSQNQNTMQKIPCIRLMPNVSLLVEEGMIAFASNNAISDDDKDFVLDLLEKAGKVEIIPESLFDAVTAISGSGPAYGFLFIEALSDAAVLFGIPRKQAIIYAAQTLKGAAQMVLETKEHPGALKDSVCSPAGTTIEAVKKLEEKGFRSAIIEAAEAAYYKSMSLSKK